MSPRFEPSAGLATYFLGPGVMTGAIIDFDQNVVGGLPRTAALLGAEK